MKSKVRAAFEASRRRHAEAKYYCALCGGEITVADNANSGLISVNVDGHAKPAHRNCPE